jgi:small-conductance mechanosensitive channel
MVCVSAGARRRAWAAENPPPPTHAAAAAPSASAQPRPLAQPMATASPQADERGDVVNFLGETIAWYRELTSEDRLAIEPAETLFVDDDRQMALEIVKLAFQYARAAAALLKSEKPPAAPTKQTSAAAAEVPGKSQTTALPGLAGLTARAQEQQNNLAQLKQQADQLKAESASAKAARRAQLARQLAIVQSQMELGQSRLDSYNALIRFETTRVSVATQGTGLSGQIDALERSVPQLNAPAKPAAPAPQGTPPAAAVTTRSADESAQAPDSGLLGTIEALIKLGKEQSALGGRINETRHLAALTDAARAPLIARLRDLNTRADALAAQPAGDDLAANRARKQQFDDLIKRHKAITDALVPLAKQGVVLQLYVANLQQWSDAVDQRSDNQLRRLVIRLSALGVLLLVIFIAAFIWRSLTFRYVQDLRRRRQLLQLRKLTVALVVGLVLLFDFASQLGTLATVMGLAAAGVALALQNVILSFAGYFFVTGRYGIRVGDRIQIAGISGDVIDIGLFKLALMELVGDGNSRQPTGRVVVFPNSIVFQTNGNFFKQAPGTSFVWNEFRLTLSPECDYRLAEKRLLEVVEDVYARYRDTVQRQYSNLERDLSMKFESPRPQSRLRLGANGIELTIRYPADTRYAVQVADEISRRALDAIAQDPALSLVMPGTPNLMPLASPQPLVAESAEPSPDVAAGGRDATRQPATTAADAMVPAAAEVVEPPASEPTAPAPRPPAKG